MLSLQGSYSMLAKCTQHSKNGSLGTLPLERQLTVGPALAASSQGAHQCN